MNMDREEMFVNKQAPLTMIVGAPAPSATQAAVTLESNTTNKSSSSRAMGRSSYGIIPRHGSKSNIHHSALTPRLSRFAENQSDATTIARNSTMDDDWNASGSMGIRRTGSGGLVMVDCQLPKARHTHEDLKVIFELSDDRNFSLNRQGNFKEKATSYTCSPTLSLMDPKQAAAAFEKKELDYKVRHQNDGPDPLLTKHEQKERDRRTKMEERKAALKVKQSTGRSSFGCRQRFGSKSSTMTPSEDSAGSLVGQRLSINDSDSDEVPSIQRTDSDGIFLLSKETQAFHRANALEIQAILENASDRDLKLNHHAIFKAQLTRVSPREATAAFRTKEQANQENFNNAGSNPLVSDRERHDKELHDKISRGRIMAQRSTNVDIRKSTNSIPKGDKASNGRCMISLRCAETYWSRIM